MSAPSSGILVADARLAEFCKIESDEGRKAFLEHQPERALAENVELLAEMVRKYVRVDLFQALRAGEAAL